MKEPDFTIEDVDIHESLRRNGLDIAWRTKSAGYGHVEFYKSKGGILRCDNECMSVDFVKDVLIKLVDKAVFDDPPKSSDN